MIREKAVMSECACPFMVSLVAGFQDDQFLYLLLEAVLGGEFFTYLLVGGCVAGWVGGWVLRVLEQGRGWCARRSVTSRAIHCLPKGCLGLEPLCGKVSGLGKTMHLCTQGPI